MTDIRLEDALAEIEHLNEQCDIFVREINAKAIEIECLRATINEQSAAIERADRLVLACEQHLRDAKHEVARFRADLRDNGIIR